MHAFSESFITSSMDGLKNKNEPSEISFLEIIHVDEKWIKSAIVFDKRLIW